MKQSLSWTLLAYAPIVAWADIPNAGSISREVEIPLIPIEKSQIATPTVQSAPSSNSNGTPIFVQQIQLNGRTLLPENEFQILLNQYIGKETTFNGLQTLAQNITAVYRQAGYPLASTIVPPQRIENGVITLQIIEGQIADVGVSNQSRISDAVATKYVNQAIKPQSVFRQPESERALLLLKDLAGTEEINYRLNPSDNGTGIAVDLGKAPLVDGFVQVDNYGSKSTGTVRTRAGVNLNSPFGRGERIAIQGMSSFKGVNFARLGADFPLGHNGLTASMGVAHTQYDLGGAFKDLEATGKSDSVDLALRYPIVRSNQKNIWLNGGVESRKLKDEIGATDTITHKNLHTANLGINAAFQDRVGYTQFSINNTVGKLKIKSADALTLDAQSAKTHGNYYKLNASVSRTQFLTPKFSLTGSLNGQWANQNLDSAEQMSLGGADAVSAYHSNDVSADSGVIGQVEARYAISPALALTGFYEAGRGRLRQKPYTDGENAVKLHGGGVGVEAQVKGLSLHGKVAWAGGDERFSRHKNPRVWVKAGYHF